MPRLLGAGFSVLDPGASIPPHRGPLDGVLRYHLGVVVPEPAQCELRVGEHTLRWTEGGLFAFDDAVRHSAYNRGHTSRVVLVIEVRADLSHAWDVVNRVGLLGFRLLPGGVDPATLVRAGSAGNQVA